MSSLFQDLRFALRLLVKSPGFTLVAVLSLALGIGANSTVFGIVDQILLRPLPVKDASRLVSVFTTDRVNQGGFFAFMTTSRRNFLDYREKNQVFDDMAASMFIQVNLSGGRGEPEQVVGEMVTGNYFSLLGVTPSGGRGFLPSEDRAPGAAAVVVLSHGLWQRRYGGDPSIVGASVTLNNQPFTVIGVAPASFRGTNALGGPEFWVPTMTHPMLLTGFQQEGFDDRRALLFQIVARLKDGVTPREAEANLKTIAAQLEQEYPIPNGGRSATLLPIAQATVNPAQRDNFVAAGAMLMTIVGLVLLIACANIANLLLARAAGRQREVAVRVSLGADRRDLLRQFMTESLVLSLLGGAAGLLVAAWARQVLWALRPAFLQANALDAGLDWRVLAFTTLVSLGTAILFGLAPAVHASRPELTAGLKAREAQPGGSVRRFSLRNALVVGQVALSLVALIAAGLFLRSLAHAQRIDPGFEWGRLAVLSVDLDSQGYGEERGRDFQRRVRERVEAIPGVEAATLGDNVPLGNGGILRTVFLEGQDPSDRRNGRFTQLNTVAPGYFRTMGIPLRRGRDFTNADRAGTPSVVIVNETMAAQFWPGVDAIGRRFRFFGQPQLNEVVGIARDIKYNFLGEPPQPFVYLPLGQVWAGAITLHVRARGNPSDVLGTVRQAVQQLDRQLPITNVFTLGEMLAQSLWAPRMGAMLLGLFAAISLTLAIVGLYGLMAYEVAQRTRELGIRLALGATREHVQGLVIRHALTLTIAGVAAGLIISLAVSRFISNLLYDVSTTDTLTFVGLPLALAAVALLASYLPARQATRIDPLIALRHE